MNKIVLLTLLFILPCTSLSAAESPLLVMGAFEFRPWYFEQDGEYVGIIHDVMASASAALAVGVSVRPTPPRRVTAELAEGNIDIGMLLTLSDAEGSIYPDSIKIGTEVLVQNELAFVAAKRAAITLNSLDDLDGYRVGAILFHTEHLKKAGSNVVSFSNNISMIKSLRAGRIDLAVSASTTLFSAAEHLQYSAEMEKVYLFDITSEIYLGWSQARKVASNAHWIPLFDAHIQRMKQSGEMRKILQKYSDLNHFR